MKSVLITGAYGGMGLATTYLLKDMGYRVFALDLNVKHSDNNIIPIKTDITSEESIFNAFNTIKNYTDSIDAIIHFAGVYMLDSLVEISAENFKRIFDINLQGVFLLNKTFLPILNKGGKIIITTSELATLDPLPFTGIYAITKSALDKYAYSLRMELQLLGITVSVLRAGAVKTDMLGTSINELDQFCSKTKLYSCNAKRFKDIVESVESRCISPLKIAKKISRILKKSHPAFSYSINRNPLLVVFNVIPKRLQLGIIKMILK